MIEVAIEYGRPVRIGVNWGSLDQSSADAPDGRELPARRAAEARRGDDGGDGRERDRIGRGGGAVRASPHNHIILSAKVSGVQDLIDVYRKLAARCDYPLHLGLTEAGLGAKGIVASTAGLGVSCCRKASATPSASR